VGEAEAITLARETHDCLLIIDEKKGRKVAEDLQITIVGLLGVLLEAKEEQLITELKPLLQQLKTIGFHISSRLVTLLLKEAGESG
jgi:hypothetical protein